MACIYPDRESKTLEFKSKVPSFMTLIKTCVAFANTAGGSIIIGVEDHTRKLLGISEKDKDRIYDEFPNSLYDATSPGLFVHIYEKNIDNNIVIIIEIPFSAKKPVYIKNEGIPKGVYLRVGTSNRRAQEEHVQDLIREGKRNYFDEEPTAATLNNLSEHLLSKCYGKNYSEKRLLSEYVLTQGINNKKYYSTVAGTLMFATNPEKYIPEANILCTQFSGTSGRQIIQTRELKGPIPEISDEALRLISHWLDRHLTLQGAELRGSSLVPPNALREAIINALLHRKYTIPGAIKIALYDNRLEIFSPGGFPGLINIKNLGDGTTYLRNPHLARIARRLHLVEKLGTGIRLIFDECKENGIKRPQYIEDGDFVKIIFEFTPDLEGEMSSDEAILKLFSIHSEVNISDVMSLLKISRNTATRKLNTLLERKLIKRLGKGPAVRYIKL